MRDPRAAGRAKRPGEGSEGREGGIEFGRRCDAESLPDLGDQILESSLPGLGIPPHHLMWAAGRRSRAQILGSPL